MSHQIASIEWDTPQPVHFSTEIAVVCGLTTIILNASDDRTWRANVFGSPKGELEDVLAWTKTMVYKIERSRLAHAKLTELLGDGDERANLSSGAGRRSSGRVHWPGVRPLHSQNLSQTTSFTIDHAG